MSGETEPDRETARLRELAVAFALSEIDGDGLQELHALLTGPRGAELAGAAWEQLDGTVDLRVGLGGPAFAEAVRLRLADDGAFARAAQRRLGRGGGLEAVAPPAPRRRRWTLRLAAFAIPMLVAGIATWLLLAATPPARIAAVEGRPLAAGVPLLRDAPLRTGDALALPAGSAIALTWRDGGAAVLAGPASAVVQPRGLTLLAGSAWVACGPVGLAIGLPDRSVALPAGARAAVQAADQASVVAVPAGAPAIVGAPAPGRIAGAGWELPWNDATAVAGGSALAAPWWELEAELIAADGAIALDPGGPLLLRGDSAELPDGRRLVLPAARPLRLALRVRGGSAELALPDSAAAFSLLSPPQALRLDPPAALAGAALRVGPALRPPLPLAGW
jgi:hypothetical protein